MSPNGTSRHFAASRQCRCFRAEADIGLDFMSTRPVTGCGTSARRAVLLRIDDDGCGVDRRAKGPSGQGASPHTGQRDEVGREPSRSGLLGLPQGLGEAVRCRSF